MGVNTIYATEANFEYRLRSRDIHSKRRIFRPPRGCSPPMFMVDFHKNGAKLKNRLGGVKCTVTRYRMIPHMILWKFCHKLKVGVLTFYYGFCNLHVVLHV